MVYMNQAEYARHRGCSAMAVSKAVKAGRISIRDGQIDPAVADQEWARNTRVNPNEHQKKPEKPNLGAIRVDSEEQAPPGSMAQAQLLHETAKARKAVLEAERMEGKYAELSQVKRAAGALVSAAKMRLRAIGNKLAPELAMDSNPAAIQAKVEAEIDEALAELARWEPDAA